MVLFVYFVFPVLSPPFSWDLFFLLINLFLFCWVLFFDVLFPVRKGVTCMWRLVCGSTPSQRCIILFYCSILSPRYVIIDLGQKFTVTTVSGSKGRRQQIGWRGRPQGGLRPQRQRSLKVLLCHDAIYASISRWGRVLVTSCFPFIFFASTARPRSDCCITFHSPSFQS